MAGAVTNVALVRAPIDVAHVLGSVADPATGATTLFLGTVRDVNDGRAVTGIEYPAYEPMAVREMAAIAAEAVALWGDARVAVVHRIGMLSLGEASVAIAVAHPRRAPAMDAQRWMIEELKRRVPIWKLEHYVDGTREWVDPTREAGTGSRDANAADGVDSGVSRHVAR
jgi:molybdopterin synthase catalytic subunit